MTVCVGGDAIQIKARGRGSQPVDYPGVELKKMSPELLEALPLREMGEGRLEMPVAMELPIRIMGSGAELNSEFVDQDLMSGDRALMWELGVDHLKLGDFVVIRHTDHRWGRSFRMGAISIALWIHGDSVMTGHGPGIMTVMTCVDGGPSWVIDPKANLGRYLETLGEAT